LLRLMSDVLEIINNLRMLNLAGNLCIVFVSDVDFTFDNFTKELNIK